MRSVNYESNTKTNCIFCVPKKIWIPMAWAKLCNQSPAPLWQGHIEQGNRLNYGRSCDSFTMHLKYRNLIREAAFFVIDINSTNT